MKKSSRSKSPREGGDDDAPRIVKLPSPAARSFGRIAATFLGTSLAAAVALIFISGRGALATAVWVAFAVLFAPLLLLLRRHRPELTISVTRDRVVLDDGTVVQRGEGQLIVQGVVEQVQTKDGAQREIVWRLRHTKAGELVERCAGPVAVRTFAEALAGVGGWPLVWMSPGDSDEIRAVEQLDEAVADRMRGAALPKKVKPRYLGVVVDDSDGVVRISPRGLRSLRTPVWQASLAGTFLGVLSSLELESWAPLWALIPLAVLAPMILPDVAVDRGGATLTRRVLGGLPLWITRVPAAQIESVYVEHFDTHRVVLAGDGLHKTALGYLTGGEAQWLKSVVLRGLAGEPVVDDTATPRSLAPAAAAPLQPGGCPRCAAAGLEDIAGPLDEKRCPQCAGRLLSSHGTERLVEGELGVTRDMLRELVRYFGGERLSCPSCGSRMSPVRLAGVNADLCQGCGSLWLDAGELSRMSRGRYEG